MLVNVMIRTDIELRYKFLCWKQQVFYTVRRRILLASMSKTGESHCTVVKSTFEEAGKL